MADKCLQLNNFNSLTAIISGLNSAPIHRLRRTWETASQKTITLLDSLNRVMNSTKNFFAYRETLHSVNPPCVPFLGLIYYYFSFVGGLSTLCINCLIYIFAYLSLKNIYQ